MLLTAIGLRTRLHGLSTRHAEQLQGGARWVAEAVECRGMGVTSGAGRRLPDWHEGRNGDGGGTSRVRRAVCAAGGGYGGYARGGRTRAV